MDDAILASRDLPLARKSVLPGAGFFLPDDLEDDLEDKRAQAALDGADVAVIADSDADGLACVALIREAYDDVQRVPEPPADDDEAAEDAETTDPLEVDTLEPTPHRVALLPASPHNVEEAIERVAEYGESDMDVYVCDLCPDRYEYVAAELEALFDVTERVSWYDHHQWDDAVFEAVEDVGVDLVVGDSDSECTADVAVRSLEADFDEQFETLAAVTRDHDLWLREDPRSDDLADYAYWTEPAEYVEVVREYGVDLPEWVEAFLTERRVEKEALIERAVARAEFHEVGPYTVGCTYGRCSQNEVAEAMREQGADASVVVKPAGSASIRGTDAFDRCHEVAGRVNGGGHPKAAGCKPDIYDDMLDFAHHWTSRGAVTKRVILEAFETVLEQDEAGDGEPDDGDE